jgi:hypothetical protein
MHNDYAELHLFIIWLNAYKARDKILEDIQSRFNIKGVYEIFWSTAHFSSNLSRFYGGKLPPGSPKEQRIGKGPFILVVVEDESPAYGERVVRSRRMETVNTNMFDAKKLYRSWTEGPDKVPDLVHTTNTPQETSHDLTLLLGRSPEDYGSELGRRLPWDGAIKKLSVDLVGAEGWSDINQLFYVLNSTIEYVVLRKFESLPGEYPLAHQEDIDLLVDNYKEACWIMNAKPVTNLPYRILNEVTIAGQNVRFDLRYVGDDYYDKRWEENILKNRVLEPGGFYRLNDEDYFYTLLYHAIIQKPVMSDDYRKKLTKMADNRGISGVDKIVLDAYMKKEEYKYVKPVDKSVYYNEEVVGGIINRMRRCKRFASQAVRWGINKLWG